MKLWEVMERIRTNGGNAHCELIVETDEIREKFGTMYDGELVKYAGVNGRVSDIPAFLGGYEVNRIDEYFLKGNSFGIGYRVYI